MAITFDEYESTPGGLVASLVSKITSNPDWSDITPQPLGVTTTGSVTSSSTTLTLTSAVNVYPGQMLTYTIGGTKYLRNVAEVNGNVVTLSATVGVTVPSGTPVNHSSRILKCTAASGAEMVIDIQQEQTHYIQYAVAHSHTGAGATGGTAWSPPRYLYWRASATGMAASYPVHVTVSAGKNHLFIAVEGPRAHEQGPTSLVYGSCKNYIFFSSVVPYHDGDVPAVMHHGSINPSAVATASAMSYQGGVSMNYDGNEFWLASRLVSLQVPISSGSGSSASGNAYGVRRASAIDGKTYMWPYVVVTDAEGIRGRLSSLFFCGFNKATPPGDDPDVPGDFIVHEGVRYKLLTVSKGDGSSSTFWGALGEVGNASSSSFLSPVVAVPCEEVGP